MHVFLDSNFCYTDPFMQKNIHNRLLIELAEKEHITLYVSEVVRKEILNNFRKELDKYFGALKTNESKIIKLLREEDSSPISWKYTVEDYIEELDTFLAELEDKGIIQIVPYSNDMLPELVERSIKRIKPFTDKKLEFRDAIIWLSYVKFANEHKLDHCYLITKNTEDFLKNGELHPDLQKDSTAFTIYKDAQEFIEKSKEVKDLQKFLELEKWVEEKDFPSNPDVIMNLIESQCFDHVYYACSNYLMDKAYSIPIKYDTYDTKWLELYGITFKSASNIDVEIVLDNIIVSGYLVVEAFFEVNERNPLYEPGEEEYFHLGSDEIDLSIRFSLILNENMNIEDIDIGDIEVN
jgi:predicted nucleic acid-binding protein